MIPARKNKIDFNLRKFYRMLFRLCLIGLIVASCTQTFTWFGEVSIGKTSTSEQRDYHHNDYDEYGSTYHNRYHNRYSSTQRSSIRYNEYQQPIEIEEDNEK